MEGAENHLEIFRLQAVHQIIKEPGFPLFQAPAHFEEGLGQVAIKAAAQFGLGVTPAPVPAGKSGAISRGAEVAHQVFQVPGPQEIVIILGREQKAPEGHHFGAAVGIPPNLEDHVPSTRKTSAATASAWRVWEFWVSS